jgi:hypothetical protein
MSRRIINSCLFPTRPSPTPTHRLLAERNAVAESRRKKWIARKVNEDVKKKNLLRKPMAARIRSRLVRSTNSLGYAWNVTKLSASKTPKRSSFFAKGSATVLFIILVPTCLRFHHQKRLGYAKIARQGTINVLYASSTVLTMKTFFVAISKIVDSSFTNHA